MMNEYWVNAICMKDGRAMRLFANESCMCWQKVEDQLKLWKSQHQLISIWVEDGHGRTVWMHCGVDANGNEV